MKKYTKEQKENIFITWFIIAAIVITVIIVRHFYDAKVIDKEERCLRTIKVCQAYSISKHGDYVTVYVNDKWDDLSYKQKLSTTSGIQDKLNRCNEYNTENVDVLIESSDGRTVYTHADRNGNVETGREYMERVKKILNRGKKKKITIEIDG